jgi:hypothetical protein
MSTEAASTEAGQEAQQTGTEATATGTGTEGAGGAAAGTETGREAAESVDQLPDWAQKIVRDARKGEGDYRAAAKTASETATRDLTDKLAAALGLKPDAATDPAALTASLTAAQQAQADTARQLAIYKAASGAGADPAKLLDSNSFLTSVKGLDPADGDAIAAAITAAVTANQSLKAVRATGASGIEQTGGTGEQGQVTVEQLQKMTPDQIVAAQEKGLLRNLLG